MATIYERNHPSGRTTWKITVRMSPYDAFCLTFNELDEAVDWIEKNEMEFRRNPEKYFEWRELVYYEMHRERKRSKNGILKPKFRKIQCKAALHNENND